MSEYKRLKPFSSGLFMGGLGELVVRRISDAEKNGFVFLSRVDKDYGEYLHTVCSNKSRFQFHHMRVGNVKCRVCMLERFAIEARLHGYEFIEQGANKNTANYKHLDCGQISNFQLIHMRVGNVVCHHCIISNRKEFAKTQGYDWLSSINKNTDQYRHIDCGRISNYSPFGMRIGSVCCKHCQEDRYLSEALEHGYEWLERAGGTLSRYKHISCGFVQTKQLDAMRKGRISCANCEGSWYTKKSTLYLIEITDNDFSWLKLGISGNIKRRLQRYGLPKSSTVLPVCQIQYGSGEEAIFIENKLHKMFEKYCLPKDKMMCFMDNGFTECYDIVCKDSLMEEIKIMGGIVSCQQKELN